METSCPIEKTQSSGGKPSSQNEPKSVGKKNAQHKRHCRESGFVLGPSAVVAPGLVEDRNVRGDVAVDKPTQERPGAIGGVRDQALRM